MQTVADELAHVCNLFPAGVVQNACTALVEYYGPGMKTIIIAIVYQPNIRCRHH